jgi:8-oxo-dGTP pyrophosphatase MutT (NUDIX family)
VRVEAPREGWEENLELSTLVRAAGGIVVREGNAGAEVLIVHRPKYDDWSFPKGKAGRGESDEQCALREVEEETGLECALGASLPTVIYRSKGRQKRVRYWLMRPLGGEFTADDEVDEVAWIGIEEAHERLTYDHDRALVDVAAQVL